MENRAEELRRQAIESLNSNPRFRRQNMSALGITEEWESSRKEFEKSIKSKFFKNDEEGFKSFLARTIDIDRKTRDSLWTYEQAQLKHGAFASSEACRKSENRQYAESQITASAASVTKLASDLDSARIGFEAQCKQIEDNYKKWRETKAGELTSAGKTEKEVAAYFASEEAVAEAAKYALELKDIKALYDDDVNFANDEYNASVLKAQQDFIARFRQTHAKELEFQLSMGADLDSAYAIASQNIKADAKEALNEMLDAGMGSVVEFILNSFSDPNICKIPKLDSNGKPVMDGENVVYEEGKYDPSAMSYLTRDDVAELKDAVNRRIAAQEQENKRKVLERTQAINASAETLKNDINWFSNGIVTTSDGRRVALDSIEDLNEREALRSSASNALGKRIKELDEAGYEKTSSLAQLLVEGPIKVQARNEKMAELVKKASAKQYAAEAQADIDADLREIQFARDGKYKVTAKIFNASTGAYEDKAIDCDSEKCIIDLITSARAVGLCKGQPYEDMLKEAQNSPRSINMLQSVVNRVFKFPQANTVMVDGKWKDRKEGTTFVLLKKDGVGKVSMSNVSNNMRVLLHDEGGLFGDKYWLNADVANQALQVALNTLNNMPVADEATVEKVFTDTVKKLVSEKAKADFQYRFLEEVTSAFNAPFESKPALTIEANKYVGLMGGDDKPLVIGGRVGLPRFSEIKNWHPIQNKQVQERLKNDIILNSESDADSDFGYDFIFGSESTGEE